MLQGFAGPPFCLRALICASGSLYAKRHSPKTENFFIFIHDTDSQHFATKKKITGRYRLFKTFSF
ncbi:MAG: hypothetical protein D6816_14030 [Bacteroidetes bacterium]|nr:MAG: hypothetical protein D6816_14030 [Bacteroidota bacterium]